MPKPHKTRSRPTQQQQPSSSDSQSSSTNFAGQPPMPQPSHFHQQEQQPQPPPYYPPPQQQQAPSPYPSPYPSPAYPPPPQQGPSPYPYPPPNYPSLAATPVMMMAGPPPEASQGTCYRKALITFAVFYVIGSFVVSLVSIIWLAGMNEEETVYMGPRWTRRRRTTFLNKPQLILRTAAAVWWFVISIVCLVAACDRRSTLLKVYAGLAGVAVMLDLSCSIWIFQDYGAEAVAVFQLLSVLVGLGEIAMAVALAVTLEKQSAAFDPYRKPT